MAEKNVSEQNTGQMAKPLIVLACLPEGSHSQMICSILQERISQRFRGHVFRRDTGQPRTPGRPEDVAVTLHLSQQTATQVSAHLEWQAGRATPQRGPEMQTPAQSGALTHAPLTELVARLLDAAPGLSPVKK